MPMYMIIPEPSAVRRTRSHGPYHGALTLEFGEGQVGAEVPHKEMVHPHEIAATCERTLIVRRECTMALSQVDRYQ